MTDEELVEGFESGALPAEVFPHEAHVRVGWWYLRHAPLLIAMARFRSALQHFAAGKGKPERYHETITIALLLLIYERLVDCRDLEWPAFAARHPELLQWQPSVLVRYYSDELLASPRAREMFLLPEVS